MHYDSPHPTLRIQAGNDAFQILHARSYTRHSCKRLGCPLHSMATGAVNPAHIPPQEALWRPFVAAAAAAAAAAASAVASAPAAAPAPAPAPVSDLAIPASAAAVVGGRVAEPVAVTAAAEGPPRPSACCLPPLACGLALARPRAAT